MAEDTPQLVDSSKPSIAVVVTVLNEAKTVGQLLAALEQQTLQPQEICITDGGSSDATAEIVTEWATQSRVPISLITIPGNRSIGRNAAIARTKCQWIALTDAGCEPEPTWLEELVAVQKKQHCRVVSGYYKGDAQTALQTAIVPYALVMPKRVNPERFLPATRSMLIEKKLFIALGKFNPALSDNEDYDFARRIPAAEPIGFAPKAIVSWQPPKTLSAFARMIFRFARGDAQAGLWRPKVILVFVRYAVVGLLFLLLWVHVSFWIWSLLLLLFVVYVAFAIVKNYVYAKSSWYWLPVLQIISDISVMAGSFSGLVAQSSVSATPSTQDV